MAVDRLHSLHDEISAHLDEIRGNFKAPVKLTFIARTPELADGGLIVTEDDCDAVIAEIQRLKDREPIIGKS